MAKRILFLLSALTLNMPATVRADWYTGKVESLSIGYDGQATGFTLVGLSRTNCTCYTPWPSNLCLSRARTSYKDELALVLSAKIRNTSIQVNINETTCTVQAISVVE